MSNLLFNLSQDGGVSPDRTDFKEFIEIMKEVSAGSYITYIKLGYSDNSYKMGGDQFAFRVLPETSEISENNLVYLYLRTRSRITISESKYTSQNKTSEKPITVNLLRASFTKLPSELPHTIKPIKIKKGTIAQSEFSHATLSNILPT